MCRDFLDEAVAAEDLERVLDAATRGPAAGNTHALDLVLLTDSAVARYWALTLPQARREDFAWPGLLRAPVLVLCYVDPDAYVRRYSEPDKADSGLGASREVWPVPYWFVDGGAAVMAMLLTAEDVGLGALFFGQFDHEPSVRRAFGVPAERRALGTLALGHPTRDGGRRSKSATRGRPEVRSVVHRGRW